MQNPVLVFGREIILEVKFTNRFPLWLEDMIRHFGLNITGAAKYVEGVAMVGEEQFNQPALNLPQVVPVPLVEEEQSSLPLEIMAKFRELQRIS
jgi:hypothetical protein